MGKLRAAVRRCNLSITEIQVSPFLFHNGTSSNQSVLKSTEKSSTPERGPGVRGFLG
jgi:hypothetical protein